MGMTEAAVYEVRCQIDDCPRQGDREEEEKELSPEMRRRRFLCFASWTALTRLHPCQPSEEVLIQV